MPKEIMIAKMPVNFTVGHDGSIRAVMAGQPAHGARVLGPFVLEIRIPQEVLTAQRSLMRGTQCECDVESKRA